MNVTITLFILLLILIYQLYSYEFSVNNDTKYPQTLAEIQTWAKTRNVEIRIDNLTRILDYNTDNNTITVESGCTIGSICDYLAAKGLALDAVPENINQTIGHACSTAACGSNLGAGSMSDLILSLEIVLNNGHIRRVEFDDPEFPAYATNLGCLGTIYSLTLKCTPLYSISTRKVANHWEIIKGDLLALLDEFKFSTVQINPVTKHTVLLLRKKVPYQPLQKPYYAVLGSETKTAVQTAIPLEKLIAAIDNLLIKKDQQEIVIKFGGPDNHSWLSPSSGRHTAWISCNNANSLIYKYLARPVWNAHSELDYYTIRLLYGKALDHFRKIWERFGGSTSRFIRL